MLRLSPAFIRAPLNTHFFPLAAKKWFHIHQLAAYDQAFSASVNLINPRLGRIEQGCNPMAEPLLSDELWNQIESLLPMHTPDPRGGAQRTQPGGSGEKRVQTPPRAFFIFPYRHILNGG
jgi:hypothetical protein